MEEQNIRLSLILEGATETVFHSLNATEVSLQQKLFWRTKIHCNTTERLKQ
jgi:hypothetical protein